MNGARKEIPAPPRPGHSASHASGEFGDAEARRSKDELNERVYFVEACLQ